MRSGGPVWLREGAVTVLWSAAAVNVFLLTFKTMTGVYKPGPLSGKQEQESNSNNESKGKEEGLLEKAGKFAIEKVLPWPLGEGPGIG